MFSSSNLPNYQRVFTLCLLKTLLLFLRAYPQRRQKRSTSSTKTKLSQAVTYAVVKGCKDAILVYPQDLESGLNERLGDIRVRSLAFKIDGDLESAGRSFIERLGLEKMVLGAFVAC